MEILRHVVVYLHIIGFAVLFGAWLVEAVARRIRFTPLMTVGLTIAAVTGLILAAPWGIDGSLNYVKLGIKLVVLLIIGALLGIGGAKQRKGALNPALFWSVGVLALLNAGIAVIWR
jgi:hypothetical protein